MARAWVANFTAQALAGATAETVILGIAGALESFKIVEFSVSIDTTAIVLVELVESTGAANGSGSSAVTLKQSRDFSGIDTVLPVQVTANTGYTAEPTTLTRVKAWRFAGPGPFTVQFPLEKEPKSLLSTATKYRCLGLRLTSPTVCNADGYIEIELG